MENNYMDTVQEKHFETENMLFIYNLKAWPNRIVLPLILDE